MADNQEWSVARADDEIIILAAPSIDEGGDVWYIGVQSRDGKNRVPLGKWRGDRKTVTDRIEQILKWGSSG